MHPNLNTFLSSWLNRLISTQWRLWLPSRGNILFTLLAIGFLVLAGRAGAFGSIQSPSAPTSSLDTIPYQGRLANSDGNPVKNAPMGLEERIMASAQEG